MKKYEYMVVYAFDGGIGRIQITTEKLIKSYVNIDGIATEVKKHNGLCNAFAIDFKLLREYEE